MKRTAIYVSIVILITGCETMFESIDNTPMGNYDLLFEYLSKDYAYKDEHAFTMDELKAQYIEVLQANPTDKTLAKIIVKIAEDLSDPHFQPSESVYTLAEAKFLNYSLKKDIEERDITTPLFEAITVMGSNEFFTHGTVKSDATIGYIYIKQLSSGFGGIGRLEGNSWKEEIESILQKLNNMKVDKMIVDIRSGAGGSNYNPLFIANRFANKSAPYMIEEYEDDDGAYAKRTYTLKPGGAHHFREGKIMLLSNNLTCSGGEMFILAMLERDNLVHIGTPTSGCAGAIIDRDLYNGWELTITSSKTTFANGDVYFKKGIRPEIIVKNDGDYYSTSLRIDRVLEKAIEEVKKHP